MVIKNVIKVVSLLAGLGFVSTSWALTIDAGATDVGVQDSLLEYTTLTSSGDTVELAWVSSVLGEEVTFTRKYDTDGSNWTLVDGESSVFAAQIGNPDYFMLKLGTGSDTVMGSHFLFTNLDDLGYAVVDLATMGVDNVSFDVTRISHIGEIGGSSSVPEPASALLLGLGLLGIAAMRKRLT